MKQDATLTRLTAHLLATTPYLAALQLLMCAWGWWRNDDAILLHWLLGMVAVYWHIRLAFDQRIFTDFAQQHYTPDEFDTCRSLLGLGKPSTTTRNLLARCQGAIRLWRRLLAVALLHALLVLWQMLL